MRLFIIPHEPGQGKNILFERLGWKGNSSAFAALGAMMGELAPQLRMWLKNYNSRMAVWQAKGHVPTPENVRDNMARLMGSLDSAAPALPLVKDALVAGPGRGVPVRIFHPRPDQGLPVLLYLHGGGHVAGSVPIYDNICRKIALAAGQLVIAVEYRLAPEYPYPAGLEDALATIMGYSGLLRQMGPRHTGHLTLAGDSAGGAMAATLCHALTNRGQDLIDRLVLLYPGLDYTLSQPSVEAFAAGYLLEKKQIQWYFDQYFQNREDRAALSPLSQVVAANFPPTLIVTAGFCPLRDEALSYYRSLQENRVAVHHLHCSDMIHAFLNMERLVPARCHMVYQAMADFLLR